MRNSTLPAIGKRGNKWQAAWRKLKPELEAAGVTCCEFGFPGCTNGIFLTPAHSLKRRNITTDEQLREVAIACQSCHAELELMREERMAEMVREVIAKR